jgi:anti-sigma B factor antagonist
MMEIKVTTENARVPLSIMHISGKIDSATHQIFQAKAEELIESGTRYILVDLANTEFVSSAGLRALHNIFNKLRSLHQDVNDDELRKKMSAGEYKSPFVKVVNSSPPIREIFEVSGFDTYIETYDDLNTAIASF